MKKLLFISLIVLVSSCSVFHKPIPQSTLQLVLVIADSATGTKGNLYQFDRKSSSENWTLAARDIPVVFGRNGIAWGQGLHREETYEGMEVKKEGDGKSPAGVFYLSSVFGYSDIPDITMPFIPVSALIECIDDVNSRYYNQVVNRNDLPEGEQPDWESSEKMSEYGIYYEQGIIVDHNTSPIRRGKGSCIFLHNWKTADDVTAGCTAMNPKHLTLLINWLDAPKKPVLALLTREQYEALRERWTLPLLE